jgi:hypothetical protein
MIRNPFVLFLAVAGLAVVAVAQSAPAPTGGQSASAAPVKKMMHKPIPAPISPLKIVYAGKTTEFTFAELATLPHKTVAVVGEHSATPLNFSGIPLTDLLARAGVPVKTHVASPRSYVVVEASDGYKAVYSLAEVTPVFRDAPVLLADAQEGKPVPHCCLR